MMTAEKTDAKRGMNVCPGWSRRNLFSVRN
jgi:hypothetical protein